MGVIPALALFCWLLDVQQVRNEVAAEASEATVSFFINVFNGQMRHTPRLVQAIYHPKNYYVLHLDAKAEGTQSEREFSAFMAARRPEWPTLAELRPRRRVSYSGVSMLDVTLSAMTLLLGVGEWDYFITMAPTEYPTVSPASLRVLLGSVPHTGLYSFVSHANGVWHEAERWWAYDRPLKISIDTEIYMAEGQGLRAITGDAAGRELPTAFHVYHGDPGVLLGRTFVEYLLLGVDGWARRALIYFANFENPLEHYFATVLCNSEAFRHFVVRDSLRHIHMARTSKHSSELLAVPLTEEVLRGIVHRGQLFTMIRSDDNADTQYDMLDSHIDMQQSGEDGHGQHVLHRAELRLQYLLSNNATCDLA